MRFDLITIFPEFFAGPLDHGIVRRAREAGITQVHVQDLREFTKDRHRTVDDRPFGGGEGMVLKPEPLFEAVEKLLEGSVGDSEAKIPPPEKTAIVLMSAAGRLFTQETARRVAKMFLTEVFKGRYIAAPPVTEFPNVSRLNELMIVGPPAAPTRGFPAPIRTVPVSPMPSPRKTTPLAWILRGVVIL
jgi:hypothetical protein